jgi:hypothetical protein
MKVTKFYLICVFVLMPFFLPGSFAAEIVVPTFEDDFETHICGSEIDFLFPPVGQYWVSEAGSDYAYHTVDCNFSFTGEASLRIERVNGGWVKGNTYPSLVARKGVTIVFEHDVYIPSGENNYVGFLVDASGSGKYPIAWMFQPYEGTWRYRTNSPGQYVNSEISAPVDEWVHITIEAYDDMTYSMWAESATTGKVTIVENAAWADNTPYGYTFRPILAPGFNGSVTWWDNVKAYWVDSDSQGYPPIDELSTSITIDGNVDTAVEWAGVRKVAHKPLDSRGNFNPWLPGGQSSGLSNDTEVDVYAAHDSDFFYIGGVMNNIVVDAEDGGSFSAVFAFYPGDGMDPEGTDYVSYQFSCNAVAAEPTETITGIGFAKYSGIPGLPPEGDEIDIDTFYNNGGEIYWKHNATGNFFNVEMKIPFVYLTEFTGVESGKKVDLQFNVIEQTGQKVATTNQIGETLPWFPSGLSNLTKPSRPYPPNVGVAFPACGDEDHPFPTGDINKDCRVDSLDIIELAGNWLISSQP